MRKAIFRSVKILHLRHVKTIITLMKTPRGSCTDPSPVMEVCLSGIMCGTRRQQLAARLPRDEGSASEPRREVLISATSPVFTHGGEERVTDLRGSGSHPPGLMNAHRRSSMAAAGNSAASLLRSAQRFLHIKPSGLTPLRKRQPQILAGPSMNAVHVIMLCIYITMFYSSA